MLTTVGSIQFFPTGDERESAAIKDLIPQIAAWVTGHLPCGWKKAVYYFETSLNSQTAAVLFCSDSDVLYLDEDLKDEFSMDEEVYDSWIEGLHELGERLQESYWNLTGESWHRLIMTILPRQEPSIRFSAEDWCDVDYRLNLMLLERNEFHAVRRSEEALSLVWDDFLNRHREEVEEEEILTETGNYIRLLERLRPHRFHGKEQETAVTWIREALNRYGLSCEESKMLGIAKGLLYSLEDGGEILTENFIRKIGPLQWKEFLEDNTWERYEYVYLA